MRPPPTALKSTAFGIRKRAAPRDLTDFPEDAKPLNGPEMDSGMPHLDISLMTFRHALRYFTAIIPQGEASKADVAAELGAAMHLRPVKFSGENSGYPRRYKSSATTT